MKSLLIATLTLASIMISGISAAEVPYGAWQGGQDRALRYEAPQEDTVTCMALYCTEPKLKRETPSHPTRDESEHESRYEIPSSEIADLIKGLNRDPRDEEIVVKDPRMPAKPATERDARDAYWKALRRHAKGHGTIEQVESAHRELLPYRR